MRGPRRVPARALRLVDDPYGLRFARIARFFAAPGAERRRAPDRSPLDARLRARVRAVHAASHARHRRRRRRVRGRRAAASSCCSALDSTAAPGASPPSPARPYTRSTTRRPRRGSASRMAGEAAAGARRLRPLGLRARAALGAARAPEARGTRRARADDDNPRGRGHVPDGVRARRDVRVHRELLGARLAARHDVHAPRAHRAAGSSGFAPRHAAVRIFGEPFRSGLRPRRAARWLGARGFRLERDESAAERGRGCSGRRRREPGGCAGR